MGCLDPTSSLPTPSAGGGTIIPGIPQTIKIFLIDEILSFIVTEADEKILIDEYFVGGTFAGTISKVSPTP
jgi:hypothetical protein